MQGLNPELFSNISALLVFVSGILSFFSPCVIPLIPLYLAYLAGGAKETDDQGETHYKTPIVFLHTLFFVLGISAAIFLLGTAFTFLGQFLNQYQQVFITVSALIIILFGIYMLWPKKPVELQKEYRIRMPQFKKMNPLVALIMGFLFSFAWTPYVGPALTAILVLSANVSTQAFGFLLIGLYTLGFIIPFLLLGLFSSAVLNWISKNKSIMNVTTKVMGVILILLGVLMLSGWFNTLSSKLASISGADALVAGQIATPAQETEAQKVEKGESASTEKPQGTQEDSSAPQAPHIKLSDQYGNTHDLEAYRGKVVFLNFWATWCPPCRQEMPDIEKLYQDYGKNTGDVIVLGVANPTSEQNQQNIDVSQPEVEMFLKDNGYTFPVVMDPIGASALQYQVNAFPTTFIINKDGTVAGYVPGALNYDAMKYMIEYALNGEKQADLKE